MSVLATLLEAGLTLEADGRRLIVTPAARISDRLRALIRANTADLITQVMDAAVRTTRLIAAINLACVARGDDPATRSGLQRECLELPIELQNDATEHFDEVAALWLRLTGRPAGEA